MPEDDCRQLKAGEGTRGNEDTEAANRTGFDAQSSKRMREEAQKRAEAALREKAKRTSDGRDPFLRAANEDDDGYDPYSDRIEKPSPWEEDPWR